MYLKYFNFREYPFNITPASKFLFMARQYHEALDILTYSILERKGFVALTGEIGTGKTTILHELLNRLGDKVDSSLILNPLLSSLDLLRSINHDFGNEFAGDSVYDALNSLNEFLLDKKRKTKNAIVIIDEAQNLPYSSLEMIRMLSNLETSDKKLLQIILVGQPELEKKLSSFQLRQLNQRIGVRYRLNPLNLNETCEYIFHRLMIAGGDSTLQFDKGALKKIYFYSGGTPRLINIVCDRVLLDAFTTETKHLTEKSVKRSIKDIKGETRKISLFTTFKNKWADL